jgi:hypothetical protein
MFDIVWVLPISYPYYFFLSVVLQRLSRKIVQRLRGHFLYSVNLCYNGKNANKIWNIQAKRFLRYSLKHPLISNETLDLLDKKCRHRF